MPNTKSVAHFLLVDLVGVVATLGAILDTQLSWESSKFQLARWSHRVVLVLVKNWPGPADPTRRVSLKMSPLCLWNMCQGYGHTPSPWWSPINSIKLATIHRIVITFPSTVIHHLKACQLDLEFESSTAKLVNLVVILVQLVPPSVALPAQLVTCCYYLLWGENKVNSYSVQLKFSWDHKFRVEFDNKKNH